jgi:hypothetical protein
LLHSQSSFHHITNHGLVLWRAHRFLNRQEATMKTSSPTHFWTWELLIGPMVNLPEALSRFINLLSQISSSYFSSYGQFLQWLFYQLLFIFISRFQEIPISISYVWVSDGILWAILQVVERSFQRFLVSSSFPGYRGIQWPFVSISSENSLFISW